MEQKLSTLDKNQIKYIQLPISVIPEIIENPVGFQRKAIAIGAYILSLEVEINESHLAKQLIYNYLTHPDRLTKELKSFITHHNDRLFLSTSQKDRYSYFYKGKELDFIISEDKILLDCLKSDEYFYNAARKWYSVWRAYDYFEIAKYSMDEEYEYFKDLNLNGQARFMVKYDGFKNFLSGESAEETRCEFACFAAIKSILGKKKFILTNKQLIAARMAGYSSIKTISGKNSGIFEKYSKRYHMDKLIRNLELKWHVKTISKPGLRGFYVSINLSLEDLAIEMERHFIKNQVEILKMRKDNARKQGLMLFPK
jgi:hypothetical protein